MPSRTLDLKSTDPSRTLFHPIRQRRHEHLTLATRERADEVKKNTYGDWRRRRPLGEEDSVEAPPAEDDEAPAAVVRAAGGTQTPRLIEESERVGTICERESTGARLGRRWSVLFGARGHVVSRRNIPGIWMLRACTRSFSTATKQ